jgi:hypothetical protein
MTTVSWLFGELTPRQLQVLRALNDGRINRGRLHGDLEPYLVEGRAVDWVLFSLALRGLVVFDLTGNPWLTSRGEHALNGPD